MCWRRFSWALSVSPLPFLKFAQLMQTDTSTWSRQAAAREGSRTSDPAESTSSCGAGLFRQGASLRHEKELAFSKRSLCITPFSWQ